MNKETPMILFVCEHGSAKSTIAAAHFNKLAREQDLNVRAISRGTDPDETFPDNVTGGLRSDGLEVEESKPKRLSDDDIADAIRIVAFSSVSEYSKDRVVDDWSDVPPVSEDYGIARNEIVRRVKSILDDTDRMRETEV